MKQCPFCAEKIQDEAIKCRYCGEFFDEHSIKEATTFKKTNRVNLNQVEVAEYLRVPTTTIETWVKKEQMPFSRLSNGKVIFRKSNIDRWIASGDVTAYSKYVSSSKKMSDILPEGYIPPSDEQESVDYVNEIHEKFISKHANKEGVPVEEYARGMKKAGTLRTFTAGAGDTRIKLKWDSKKREYYVAQGEEAYIKHYKKDRQFRAVIAELSILMCILDSWY